jgi:hypothetical protein
MWPFLRRVRESLSALPRVQFVYIATRPNHFEAARAIFELTAPRVTNPDSGVEGLRYLTYRRHKEYAKLDAEQVQYLKDATERYRDTRIEALYRPWLLGQIPVNGVTEEFQRLAPRRNVSFWTELVDGQTALFESSPTSEEKSGMKRRGGKKAALAAPKDGKSFRISPRPSS